jgi:ribonuclease HI
VVIYTDGACIGNPGPGGWAARLRFDSVVGEIFGSEPRTTNNRMELRAVIEALRALKEPCDIVLHTDSQYLRLGITEWIVRWKQNGWKTRERSDVLNKDLWLELDELSQRHTIAWHWVKGHADDRENDRVDYLATTAARDQIKSNGVVRSE